MTKYLALLGLMILATIASDVLESIPYVDYLNWQLVLGVLVGCYYESAIINHTP